MGLIDLHVHSSASDGTLTPSQVVRHAVKQGVSAFALTDHDTIEGVKEAIEESKNCANEGIYIEVIAGTELSVAYRGRDIHMLGLFLDITNEKLNEFLEIAKQGRIKRNEKMIANLQEAGIQITMEDLAKDVNASVITRAHFARHLVETGVVKTKDDAFRRYLDSNTPYYVAREFFTPKDAIDMIHQAGGLAVLAHPLLYGYPRNQVETLVTYLESFGLDGIETYYSANHVGDEYFIKNLARRHNLLMTGGSDYHGSNKPDIELGIGRGKLVIPPEILDTLKEAISVRH